MSETDERIIDLDDYDYTCRDDAVVTLQMLVKLHNEPHRLWCATRSEGGAWDYKKV